MPLQHASAPVLKRMKRGASGDIFLKLIERIRKTIPHVAIRTSFIAGFPGETEEDFKTLCQFVEAAQLDRVGVFSYSDEDSSVSHALDGKVDGRTIERRKRGIMAIQRKISRKKNKQMVGEEVQVIVEGLSPDTDLLWSARMSTQAPEIDGTVLINDVEGADPAPGQMRMLRITEAHDYDLIGTLLPGTEDDLTFPPAPLNLINISVPSQLPAR